MIPEKHKEPYKIVYLLHGLHGNQGSWINNSMLPFYGKKYNAIFVMPEAGRSFYIDLTYGRKYFTFISEELPQICRRVFNISAKREDTAVIGYSMGGFGALLLALSKPEQYGFCGSISPACLFPKPQLEAIRRDIPAFMKTDYEPDELIKDLYSIHGHDLVFREDVNIPELAKNYPGDKLKPKIYLTCGTEDNLLGENNKFRDEIKKLSFDFTYEEWSGGHNWDFFNEALKKTLKLWYKDFALEGESQFSGDE
jgi:S-formylglutathione hydrolase FrmB